MIATPLARGRAARARAGQRVVVAGDHHDARRGPPGGAGGERRRRPGSSRDDRGGARRLAPPADRSAATGTRPAAPEVAGVPVIVPLAWWAMAVPAREAAHAALGAPRSASPARRRRRGADGLGPVPRPADDRRGVLALGPPGRYRGIPLTNFAGWLVTAPWSWRCSTWCSHRLPPIRSLVGEYASMGVMETSGSPPSSAIGGRGRRGSGDVPFAAAAVVAGGRGG